MRSRIGRADSGGVALHDHRRAVAKDFGDAAHDLGGIVADADDGVCAQFLCVAMHQLERLVARFLAKAREQRNIAADERLQGPADRAEDRP